MARTALRERAETLERTVGDLPARVGRVEREIAELRAEMRGEFAAVRAESAAGFAAVRAEIREGDAETRRYMRVLYEDLVERIKTLGEQINGPRHG